ncbi:MAG: hypothetical protein MHPSP_003281, partial [Paramarteilia canceri]
QDLNENPQEFYPESLKFDRMTLEYDCKIPTVFRVDSTNSFSLYAVFECAK